MARATYGSTPEGWAEHDKLLIETQVDLLQKVQASNNPRATREYAEAYALISGHIVSQGIEVKNG